MNSNLYEKILNHIKEKGSSSGYEIVKSLNLSWSDTIKLLDFLEKNGIICLDEIVDPTKPFATSVWKLCQPKNIVKEEVGAVGKDEMLGTVEGLILNPPLLRDIKKDFPAMGLMMGLMDSLEFIVSSTKKSLKIMMPYVGELLSILFTSHLQNLKKIDSIQVITEDRRENKRTIEPLKQFLPNLQVAYATKRESDVKVTGIHAKVLIADEEIAVVGTFNLLQIHLLVDYDIGVFVKGEVVHLLAKIFDDLWEQLTKPQS